MAQLSPKGRFPLWGPAGASLNEEPSDGDTDAACGAEFVSLSITSVYVEALSLATEICCGTSSCFFFLSFFKTLIY